LSCHSSPTWSSVREKKKDWGEIKEMEIREREKDKGMKEGTGIKESGREKAGE
jgi:hypothetical protein